MVLVGRPDSFGLITGLSQTAGLCPTTFLKTGQEIEGPLMQLATPKTVICEFHNKLEGD